MKRLLSGILVGVAELCNKIGRADKQTAVTIAVYCAIIISHGFCLQSSTLSSRATLHPRSLELCQIATADIRIDDLNDHSPRFGQRSYQFRIDALPFNNTEVGSFRATDGDNGEFGRVRYRMLEEFVPDGKGGEEPLPFVLFQADGGATLFYVVKPLHLELGGGGQQQYQPQQHYTFTVEAFDSVDDPRTAHVTEQLEELEEDNVGTASHGGAVVVDEDELWTKIDTKLADGEMILMRICREMLYTTENIEARLGLALLIDCTELFCKDALHKRYQHDKEEGAERLDDEESVVRILCLAQFKVNTLPMLLKCLDDHGKLRVVRLERAVELLNGSNLFKLDTDGMMSVRPGVDIDRERVERIIVKARLKSRATLHPRSLELCQIATADIRIDDLNDHSPRFGQRSYQFRIDARPFNNTEVGSLRATDGDNGEFGRVRYRMLEEFVPDGKGGEEPLPFVLFQADGGATLFYVVKPLHLELGGGGQQQYQPQQHYTFTVEAFDSVDDPRTAHVTEQLEELEADNVGTASHGGDVNGGDITALQLLGLLLLTRLFRRNVFVLLLICAPLFILHVSGAPIPPRYAKNEASMSQARNDANWTNAKKDAIPCCEENSTTNSTSSTEQQTTGTPKSSTESSTTKMQTTKRNNNKIKEDNNNSGVNAIGLSIVAAALLFLGVGAVLTYAAVVALMFSILRKMTEATANSVPFVNKLNDTASNDTASNDTASMCKVVNDNNDTASMCKVVNDNNDTASMCKVVNDNNDTASMCKVVNDNNDTASMCKVVNDTASMCKVVNDNNDTASNDTASMCKVVNDNNDTASNDTASMCKVVKDNNDTCKLANDTCKLANDDDMAEDEEEKKSIGGKSEFCT